MTEDDARARALRILVRSFHKELVAQGYDDKQILAVAIELVGKVTETIAHARQPRPRRA